MTVCKYYLQGRCKFGDNCRYEHSDGGGANRQLQFGGGGKDKSNRYKWTAPQQDNKSNSGRGQSTPEDLLVDVKGDIEQWEASKIWPFSCLGLDKDMPCIPGFADISVDEMRWEAYNNKATGNFQAYLEKVNQLSKQYKSTRELFKMPNSHVKEDFKQFILKYRQTAGGTSNQAFPSQTMQSFSFTNPDASTNSLFGSAQSSNSGFGTAQSSNSGFGTAQSSNSGFGTAQSANSGFGNAQSTNSLFGQGGSSLFGNAQSTNPSSTNSLFGQQSQISTASTTNPGTNNSAFGGGGIGVSNSSNNSIFGQKGLTGGGGFGTSSSGNVSSNPFGQQTQNTGSVFGQSQLGSALQGNSFQGTFGNSQGTSSPAAGFFTSTSSNFGNSDANKTTSVNPTSAFGAKTSGGSGENSTKPATYSTLYTPREKLSAEDIAQFESNFFTIGRIPVKPPPRDLVR